ncbi:MAG: hypothetical protein K9J30_09350 [Bacteroidales bacterium]|nr:hypothetical protein [Bacteroidales bacterium]
MKKKISVTYLLIIVIAFGSSSASFAQFYNGMQMKFGKNRVQFSENYWKFYRYERFDVYSYEEGGDLSLYVGDFVEKELPLIERFFDYDIEQRLIFICYNKMSDFRQSNIGLMTEDEEYNTGGTTKIIQNKVALYFNGNHIELERQVRAAIAEVLINEFMFGKNIVSNVSNTTTINLPDWYVKGLISYVSNPWDYQIENRVKDGINSGKFTKLVKLTDDDAVYAGHSLWKYIADLYGASIIPNILYLTKVNKSAEDGFLYVLGQKLKDISADWSAYYLGVFLTADEKRALPEADKRMLKPKKKMIILRPEISPDGKYLSYITNQEGKFKIWIQDINTGKRQKIFKRGQKLDQEHDYSFPVTDWHPSGEILGFITEEKGNLFINYYNVAAEELTTRRLFYFEKVLDMDFSPDRRKIAFSAVFKGQTDIYSYDIASATTKQITDDLADDFHPRFINGMNEISFSSNRRYDTLYTEGNDPPNNTTTVFSIYIYNNRSNDRVLRKISEGNYVNHLKPEYTGNDSFVYLSDKNGIYNMYYAEYDSAIAYIDTSIHYRYISKSHPISNYKRNILDMDYNAATKDISNVIFHDGRYHLYNYTGDLSKELGDELTPTEFRKKRVDRLLQEDSIHHIEQEIISINDIVDNQLVIDNDTIQLPVFDININNYVFEREKIKYYNEQLRKKRIFLVLDTEANKDKTYIDYRTTFYPDQLVSQIDFSFLNAAYQPFTGNAFYFNPGFNMLFKVGANDLFEDYRIIGGVRFSADFNSNEYLLSFENLKNRLDQQVVFHRQAINNVSENALIKTFTHEVHASVKYPFNQVLALRGTGTFRHDNSIFLSTDIANLTEDNILKVWGGVKLELIFDNSRYLGTNLLAGTRFKVFGEAYRQINTTESDLYVLGADFRHYIRIHRSLIWANRFAGSASFGRSPLIYYLGAVDNWTNLLQLRTPTFNESVDIDYTRNYSYQAIATNLRGFSQNIRNGSNFSLINSEIRWPLFRYLANHPLSSAFFNNFQIVGFGDIGAAWTGLHPFTGKNAWDTETIPNNPEPGTPVVVTINSNRSPIVGGIGFGVRSQLFGYFIRLDWAWGIEHMELQPRIFYLSLTQDF